jgi:anhydro-N-acetylmuramic acid kinase
VSDGAELYLGLISGTSADAIDVVLARFGPSTQLVARLAVPYPASLRSRVLALARSDAAASLDELGRLDVELGAAFADAALALLEQAGVSASSVHALGSHGQTVRHGPYGPVPFTTQLGDPNVIAERTGITTVADFRRRDMAASGQGAPLLPALHDALFSQPGRSRVVLNLGGIANITLLSGDAVTPVRGFDTGPANCLMDAWSLRHRGIARDEGGVWAASGKIDAALLRDFLSEPYFALPAPKSTGRELFNLDWLDHRLAHHRVSEVDVQATLLELSVRTIANAIRLHGHKVDEVLACGGGVHNEALMSALRQALAPATVKSTADYGMDPDFVEATAFAWLARRRLQGLPGNLPAVTGARGARVLGAIYFGLSST